MKRILVTTIRRGRPIEDSGAAYVVDWDTHKVIAQCGMLPVNARFPRNPRGGIRGLRGCCVGSYSAHKFLPESTNDFYLYIATNDTVCVLDPSLELQGTIHNPLFCNLHDLVFRGEQLYAVSCGIDSIVNVYAPDDVLLEGSNIVNMPRFIRFDHMDRHGTQRPNSVAFFKERTAVSFAAKNSIVINPDSAGDGKRSQNVFSASGIQKPHSLVWYHKLYFTSAAIRKVMCMDVKNGGLTEVYTDKKPWWFRDTKMTQWGWLRGLAITKYDRMFVGSSPYARIISKHLYRNSVDELRLSKFKHETVSAIALFPGDWE